VSGFDTGAQEVKKKKKNLEERFLYSFALPLKNQGKSKGAFLSNLALISAGEVRSLLLTRR
jgi:hypothetical protein